MHKPLLDWRYSINLIDWRYYVCVVFTLNRSFYPTSEHPVSVLIHPTEIQIMWSQRCQETGNRQAASQSRASAKAFPSV